MTEAGRRPIKVDKAQEGSDQGQRAYKWTEPRRAVTKAGVREACRWTGPRKGGRVQGLT